MAGPVKVKRDHSAIGLQYAQDVINGKIPACCYVKKEKPAGSWLARERTWSAAYGFFSERRMANRRSPSLLPVPRCTLEPSLATSQIELTTLTGRP